MRARILKYPDGHYEVQMPDLSGMRMHACMYACMHAHTYARTHASAGLFHDHSNENEDLRVSPSLKARVTKETEDGFKIMDY